jgi:hypothetical protein
VLRSEIEGCILKLAENVSRGKCYIHKVSGYGWGCFCSVEQYGAGIWDLDGTFQDAFDGIWSLIGDDQGPQPNWGISHQGSLSIMYGCNDTMSGRWWIEKYGRIPNHFGQTGFVKTYNR